MLSEVQGGEVWLQYLCSPGSDPRFADRAPQGTAGRELLAVEPFGARGSPHAFV